MPKRLKKIFEENRSPRPKGRGSLFFAPDSLDIWHKSQDFFAQNKTWTIAGIIAAVGVVLVLILFKDEVDRFTFIMPIFAAFIVVGILTLADEEEKKEKKS